MPEMGQEQIEEKLGHQFTDRRLLQQALTHSSIGYNPAKPSCYERLEFLGDAVLELVVSMELFTMYPDADEGELTKMRASIVSRRHLAAIASKIGLGNEVFMSPRLKATGGSHSVTVLGNTLESLIGAVMQDAGFTAARKAAMHLLRESLENACPTLATNPKGDLQELLQGRTGEAPTYRVTQLPGTPVRFSAVALWQGREIGSGTGSSKHKAEIAAAAAALARVQSQDSTAPSGLQSDHEAIIHG